VSLVTLPGTARADLGNEPSKTTEPPSSASQVEDTDKPKDSILDKKPADAAVASKQAQASGPAFWEKWQFWAIAGGIVVGGVVAVIATQKISHQVSGGDARPCSPMFVTCQGAGH
jgi:hypothetical protein